MQALAEAIKAQTNELHTSVTSMKEMLQNIDRSSRQVSSPTHCEAYVQSAAPSLPCPQALPRRGACDVQQWAWHALRGCRKVFRELDMA